jgi:hypothetical protein
MPIDTDQPMKIPRFWVGALALAAALLVAGAAHAQQQTGNLYGSVVDEHGDALPGVTITLTSKSVPQVQVTDAKGRFRFVHLGAGSYGLKSELEGFTTAEFPNIVINVGRNTTIGMEMSAAEDISAGRPRPSSEQTDEGHDVRCRT